MTRIRSVAALIVLVTLLAPIRDAVAASPPALTTAPPSWLAGGQAQPPAPNTTTATLTTATPTTATPTPAPASSAGQLPRTGADLPLDVLVAASMIGAGAALRAWRPAGRGS